MTDQEFRVLLKRNLTLKVDYNRDWCKKPCVEIKLELRSHNSEESSTLATIRIDSDDLKTEE